MWCVIYLVQSQGHLKCPDGVHVRGDDGDPSVSALGVPECVAPHEVHLREVKKMKQFYRFVRCARTIMVHSVLLQSAGACIFLASIQGPHSTNICIQVSQVSCGKSHPELFTHLAPRLECAPLWTEEDILEVQLDVILDAGHFGNRLNR